MTFCRGSPPKYRNSKPHGSHSHGAPKNNYGHGMRGHSYKRINGGRMCTRCDRTWIL